MPNPTKVSPEGLNAMKQYEGTVKDPISGKHIVHSDPVGIPTVGYGHKLTKAEIDSDQYADGLTEAEATDLFAFDVKVGEKAVTDLVTADLNQNQFDVLVDFAFNAGRGTFRKSSILKAVNQGNFQSVPGILSKYNKAYNKQQKKLVILPGLVSRRAAQGVRFNTPVMPIPPAPPAPTAPPAPPPTHDREPHDKEPMPHDREAPHDREMPHDREAPHDREMPHDREAPHDREIPHDRGILG